MTFAVHWPLLCHGTNIVSSTAPMNTINHEDNVFKVFSYLQIKLQHLESIHCSLKNETDHLVVSRGNFWTDWNKFHNPICGTFGSQYLLFTFQQPLQKYCSFLLTSVLLRCYSSNDCIFDTDAFLFMFICHILLSIWDETYPYISVCAWVGAYDQCPWSPTSSNVHAWCWACSICERCCRVSVASELVLSMDVLWRQAVPVQAGQVNSVFCFSSSALWQRMILFFIHRLICCSCTVHKLIVWPWLYCHIVT